MSKFFFFYLILVSSFCYSQNSSLVGLWEMSHIERSINDDYDSLSEPYSERWIQFNEDSTFTSGAFKGQLSSRGTWSSNWSKKTIAVTFIDKNKDEDLIIWIVNYISSTELKIGESFPRICFSKNINCDSK